MSDPVSFHPPVASLLRPTRRLVAGFVACFMLAVFASSANAQGDSPGADKLTALRLEWLSQLATQESAVWEADVISPARGAGLTVGNFQDPSAILKELSRVLTEDYDSLRNRLLALATKATAKREDMQKDWAEVIRQRVAFRQYAEKQQAAWGFDYESGSPPGFQPNLVDAVLVVWGIVVVLVAVRLRRKELRLEIRRTQRAALVCLLVGVLALPGCGGPPAGADTRPWAIREESDLTNSVADATEKAKAAVSAANKKWAATVDGWVGMVAAPSDTVDADLRRAETDLRDRLRTITVDARLADRLAKDADDQRAKLADEKTKLDDMVSGARWRSTGITVVRVGLAALLFGFTIAPFWSARRLRAKRIRTAARTCPRCFRLNTLKVERTGGGESSPKYRGKGKKRKSEEEDDPPPESQPEEDSEAVCTKCGLRIRKSYLTVPRLCFPTVGIRSSGKTHMLVTAYDRIRKRTAPTIAVMQPAPSGGDVDRRFAQLIDEILHRRGEAGATDLVLPDPILLHLKDTDPAGANPAIVNLFDYSGELINPEVDVNQLKDTAVRMDGFMLFLDPTQLAGDVTLDTQLANLDEFLNHMRRKRGVPVGKPIPVPVAVCISKFDLLTTENPIGVQSIQYIRELQENLNPPPRQVTPDLIRERSELVEQMLPMMFPGADIRGVIEGYFGTQLMFFPISSVSLFEHELGVKDLSRRNMVPFGVAEPIMWLLHMHGYEVFA
jgi:hypothetical protein